MKSLDWNPDGGVTVAELDPDQLWLEQPEGEQVGDVRVGVVFEGKLHPYTYSAPQNAHVYSTVIVPPSIMCPVPQVATVITLSPPPYAGPVKRVLAVLS